jgi:hypothetical protein
MSVLLYVVGAVAIMAGAVMVGFGVPINEFSFGNTLIASGVTAFMGGLVILGLGAVVGQLHRVVEALAALPPMRAGRPMEAFEQPVRGTAAGRIPFPPKPKADFREPDAGGMPLGTPPESANEAALAVTPTLRNPDEPPVAVEDSEDLSLSPRQSAPSPLRSRGSGGAQSRPEPALGTGWRAPPPLPPMRPPQTGHFDAMWPATETRQTKAPPPPEPKFEQQKPGSKFEPKPDFKLEPKTESKPEPATESPASVKRVEPEAAKAQPAGEMRPVAILKSGVVDGMGYTLYVDGSIEADLPQGTLRFASINELRSHLEKNP